MKAVSIASVVAGWHDQGVPVARIFQPAYSPELNPVERIFELLRDRVEGEVYDSLAAKRAAVEAELQQLAADPEVVKWIAGWKWILDSIAALAA